MGLAAPKVAQVLEIDRIGQRQRPVRVGAGQVVEMAVSRASRDSLLGLSRHPMAEVFDGSTEVADHLKVDDAEGGCSGGEGAGHRSAAGRCEPSNTVQSKCAERHTYAKRNSP